MSRHSVSARIAALVGGLVLVGSGLAMHPPAAAAASARGPVARALASHPATRVSAGSRGTVNVRDLARTSKVRAGVHPQPAIRSLHQTSTKRPGAPKVVTPAPPTSVTPNVDPAANLTIFQGINQNSPLESSVEPPDPYLAVGPDDVVQVVNLLVRTTDRNGAAPVNVALADFFLLPTDGSTFDTDPRVIYDSLHGRWFASEASWDCLPDGVPGGATIGHGYLDIAISDTADPRGAWQVYFATYNDAFPDYPGLGTSSDKLAISANLYGMTAGTGFDCIGNTFQGADISTFDWTDVANGGGLTYNHALPNPNVFTLRPSVQAPATSPDVHWIAYADIGGGDIEMDAGVITGSVGTNTVDIHDTTLEAVVAPPLDPPQPHQPLTPGPATISEAVDFRITDAIWQANKMTWVATYPCTPATDTGPRDCVRVTQLSTTATPPTLLQDFVVNQLGEDLFMGGVGVTGNGALHVVWTQSSATAGHYASTYGAYQLPTDTANTLNAPQVLGAGDADYPGTRWGDYVGVPQDPQDPDAVWAGAEYSSGGLWQTKVAEMATGTGSTYVPIAPVRVLNTISGIGLSGTFHSGLARTFQVAGVFGIPGNATAITGNLAVTRQTGAGFVSVTVDPTNTPATSTINFPLGDVRANNVTTRLSATGSLSALYKSTAGKTTHLVLDVTGYFVADDSGATYNPIPPVRMLNTIAGTGLAGKFQNAVPRTFQIAGVSGIPANATAISGNLAVANQTSAGFVSVTPDPVVAPSTSNINFPVGDVRANGLTVQLSGTGSLSAVFRGTAGSRTDLVLDVSGYYVQDLLGLRFFPLNPGRRVNTLTGIPFGIFHSGTPQTAAMDGHEGVPLGASAITGNLAVLQQTQGGFVSITPDPTLTPATSVINFPVGDVRANGVTVPVNGSGAMSFLYKAGSASRTTQLVLDVTGYFK